MVSSIVTFSSQNIQRHFRGDIFQDKGCSPSSCASAHSSPHLSPVAVAVESEKHCSCQCDPEWPTFREDTTACVDTVQECQLADFVTGGSTEKIPFVFLPLFGQLVYPSASLAIPTSSTGGGPVAPIC